MLRWRQQRFNKVGSWRSAWPLVPLKRRPVAVPADARPVGFLLFRQHLDGGFGRQWGRRTRVSWLRSALKSLRTCWKTRTVWLSRPRLAWLSQTVHEWLLDWPLCFLSLCTTLCQPSVVIQPLAMSVLCCCRQCFHFSPSCVLYSREKYGLFSRCRHIQLSLWPFTDLIYFHLLVSYLTLKLIGPNELWVISYFMLLIFFHFHSTVF